MRVNKDVIRQIILDFNKFKEQDCWTCSFEDIVEEFVKQQTYIHLIVDLGVTEDDLS